MLAGKSAGGEAGAAPTRTVALDPKWEKRFAFFDANGSPFSKEATAASRELGFGERAGIFFNIWALALGIIYFIYLGIPRRGLGLLLPAIAIAMVLWGFDTFLYFAPNWYWMVLWVIYGVTANYYYYIKIRHGRDEWNPAKDLFS
nr:DUF2628 domain-containing protein [Altericroceibacterium endophyticum]